MRRKTIYPHSQPWAQKKKIILDSLDSCEFAIPLSSLAFKISTYLSGLPQRLSGEESVCNAGSIPGLGRSPGGGNDNPLQYSCLEDPMDRGAWQATQSMGSQRVGLD